MFLLKFLDKGYQIPLEFASDFLTLFLHQLQDHLHVVHLRACHLESVLQCRLSVVKLQLVCCTPTLEKASVWLMECNALRGARCLDSFVSRTISWTISVLTQVEESQATALHARLVWYLIRNLVYRIWMPMQFIIISASFKLSAEQILTIVLDVFFANCGSVS